MAFDWTQVEIAPRKWYEAEYVRHYTYRRALLRPDALALSGQRITVTGYILPGFEEFVHQFVLTKDANESLQTPARIDQMVLVTLAGDEAARWVSTPVTVSGELRVEELLDAHEPDGNPWLVYRLDDATVLRVPHAR